jgi:hypothetical protein
VNNCSHARKHKTPLANRLAACRRSVHQAPFLNIAEASLAEVGYCIHAAHRLGYVSEQLRDELEKDIKGVGAPLAGLVRSTKADLTLSALGVGFLLLAIAWFAA